ncbi:uncharacterized protein [Patagioenas fasciata]|uniref:uncharacterized protein n=1 Tax=Patagioenas fasciata TaxID=372321 RepID=UPI003A993266
MDRSDLEEIPPGLQSARVLASGSVVSRGGYRELTGTGVGAAAERLLQPAPGDLEAVGSGQPFVRSPEAAERKETTERQRGPPAAEVSGARRVSVPAEPGGTVGECEGNGAAKEAAGGAVNARCSADPPAQVGNGTWGAAPGWETRRRPPSPVCGRGAGGDSRPGADAGGRAEDVAVRSQPGGCRWLRPPRAGEARLAAWREKGRGSTSRAWAGAAAAGAREVGERLRTAERPELPERKGGEKETGASELLEASWQPPKARAARSCQVNVYCEEVIEGVPVINQLT